MRRKWLRPLPLLLLLLILSGCGAFRPGFISDESWDAENDGTITPDDFDGPLNGHFDDEGNWVPDDATITWTYCIPDISAGFLFDINSSDLTPGLQIELLEFDLPITKYLRTWKLDGGAAYQRAYIYLGPRITSIFEISVGGFIGWNFDDNQASYGVAATIIKF